MSGSFDITAIVATAILSAAVTAFLVVLAQRRSRRQVALLFERLAEVEAQLRPSISAHEAIENRRSGDLNSIGDADSTPIPDDPLAGKTSTVRRMVESLGADAECLADEAIICVHHHLKDSYSPHQLAEELSVSLRTLERGLGTSLGCTPTQLIHAVKMREARRLLLSGRYQVGEVARQLDFATPQHFSRRFKEFYGIPPGKMIKARQ